MIYITKNNSSVVVYNDKDNIRKTIPLSKVEMVSDKSDIIVLRWYETQKPFIQFRWDEYAPSKDIALNKLDNLLYGCGGGGGGTADCSEVEAQLLEAKHEITELQYQIDHYDCSQYATEHKNELLADWTGDANITPSRVLAGYSGYANGQKVVGSYVPPTGGDCSEVEALLQDAQGRIEDLENDLTAKDATINGLENDLNAANNTIGQKDRRITSLENTNQQLGNQINELESDLEACNTAGAQKDAQIADKDITISEQTIEIARLIDELRECEEGGEKVTYYTPTEIWDSGVTGQEYHFIGVVTAIAVKGTYNTDYRYMVTDGVKTVYIYSVKSSPKAYKYGDVIVAKGTWSSFKNFENVEIVYDLPTNVRLNPTPITAEEMEALDPQVVRNNDIGFPYYVKAKSYTNGVFNNAVCSVLKADGTELTINIKNTIAFPFEPIKYYFLVLVPYYNGKDISWYLSDVAGSYTENFGRIQTQYDGGIKFAYPQDYGYDAFNEVIINIDPAWIADERARYKAQGRSEALSTLTEATATASDILSGKVVYGNNGEKIEGTLECGGETVTNEVFGAIESNYTDKDLLYFSAYTGVYFYEINEVFTKILEVDKNMNVTYFNKPNIDEIVDVVYKNNGEETAITVGQKLSTGGYIKMKRYDAVQSTGAWFCFKPGKLAASYHMYPQVFSGKQMELHINNIGF